MKVRRGERTIGALAEPEVDDALDLYTGAALGPKLSIEGATLADSPSFAGTEAGSGEFLNVRMTGASLSETRLRGVRLLDVVARDLDAIGADWTGATMSRVRFENCRLTGLQLPEAELKDVTFESCKIDYGNFRMARLENVTFDECVFDDADFSNSVLDHVEFPSCEIRDTDFHGAQMSRVDLRGAALSLRGSAASLSGAIVSSLQLIDLAPALAQELGIEVENYG